MGLFSRDLNKEALKDAAEWTPSKNMSLYQAKIELRFHLISRGYSPEDTEAVIKYLLN